jgi:hypothetical protein
VTDGVVTGARSEPVTTTVDGSKHRHTGTYGGLHRPGVYPSPAFGGSTADT